MEYWVKKVFTHYSIIPTFHLKLWIFTAKKYWWLV